MAATEVQVANNWTLGSEYETGWRGWIAYERTGGTVTYSARANAHTGYNSGVSKFRIKLTVDGTSITGSYVNANGHNSVSMTSGSIDKVTSTEGTYSYTLALQNQSGSNIFSVTGSIPVPPMDNIPVYVNVSGTIYQADSAYANVGGTVYQCEVYININGTIVKIG